MKWITRARLQIDRVACPWPIVRFIDNGAINWKADDERGNDCRADLQSANP